LTATVLVIAALVSQDGRCVALEHGRHLAKHDNRHQAPVFADRPLDAALPCVSATWVGTIIAISRAATAMTLDTTGDTSIGQDNRVVTERLLNFS
jgi:hypothetical protein